MKKKILALALCVAMSVTAFAGCAKKKDSTNDSTTGTKDYASMKVDQLHAEVFDGQEKYVKPGDYSSIPVTVSPVAVVTDGAVEEEVRSWLDFYPLSFSGTCASGDTVNIDYVGTIDGKEFDGGSAKGEDLELGSGSFIPGFEEQVEGMSVGDSKDINVKFPDDYTSEDVAGKAAVFNVKLNYVKLADENFKAELSDDWVKTVVEKENISDRVTDLTVDGFRAFVKETLEEDAKNNYDSAVSQAILKYVVENSDQSAIPDDVKKEFIDKEIEEQTNDIQSNYGMSLDEYLEAVESDEETFKSSAEANAIDYMNNTLTLLAIADKEDIKITQEDYDDYVKSVGDYYTNAGYISSIDEFKSDYLNNYGTLLYEDLIYEEVLEFLRDNAKITEAE